MRDPWRRGVWLVLMAGAGACDRCSWRLEYVEADGATMAGSSDAGLTDGTDGTDGTDSTSGASTSGVSTGGTSGGEVGSTSVDTSGADDLATPGPICGDGAVGPGEECDDGNEVDTDDCSNDCWAPRTVFITEKLYGGALGGVQGADGKCGAGAASSKLPGTFKAWISDADPGSAPAVRFGSADFRGWYVRPDGKKVARGWDALTSGGDLLVPIDVMESGEKGLSQMMVWSNTAIDGTAGGNGDCQTWSEESEYTYGTMGITLSTSPKWTASELRPCDDLAHLYCFQVK